MKPPEKNCPMSWEHRMDAPERFLIFSDENLNICRRTFCWARDMLQLFQYEKICLSYFVDNVFQTRDHLQTIALLKSGFHKKLKKLTRVYKNDSSFYTLL